MPTAFEEALARLAVDSGRVSTADAERAADRAASEGITLLDALVESGCLDGTTGARLAEEAARSLTGESGRSGSGEPTGAAIEGTTGLVEANAPRANLFEDETRAAGDARIRIERHGAKRADSDDVTLDAPLGVPRAAPDDVTHAAPDGMTRAAPDETTNAAPADVTRAAADDPEFTVAAGGETAAPFDRAPRVTEGRSKQPPFPIANWDRYRFIRLIGEGGMGRVFFADDPKLGRQVALKFIRGGEGAPVERFLQEARAQATVEHDNICRIYEVGEAQGRPFIAMQFVDGEPLDVAARELSLESKLLLVAQIAEAVHAAHRQGLIHRDIKPANILVERSPSGRLKPYLVDFGLAREQAATGLTMTGAVLGTPQYMAPEQAAGESTTLDRRADVYALGATLYAIVSGRPPFRGKTLAVLLRQVIEEVPAPLRTGDEKIPADVDAIVMKCMRKDPRERYASARGLARDLRRYLDGEPVEARPTGLLYRLRMKAVKNRLAVSVAAVATLLVLAATAWGAYSAWTASRRARLAQEFGRQVESIESFARVSYMLPLHDVRPDRQEIERRMAGIEARMDELGAIARGPGLYALARGDLVLGRFAEARERLEAARAAGYDDPQLDYALGRAFGELYMQAHEVALRLSDKTAREQRLAAIDEELKRPALAALQRGRGASLDATGYVEALVALYEKDYDDAIASANAAWVSRPFQYEARSLEGRIETQKAVDRGFAGDFDGALAGYDRAETALRDAAAIGRSDPQVYADLCALYPARMKTEFHGLARDPSEHYRNGLEACRLATTADPEGLDALIQIAALQNRMAEYAASRGEDGSALLRASIETARRIADEDPGREEAHDALASAHATLARIEIDAGEDPRASLDGAVGAFESGLALREEHWRYNDLGIVYKLLAQLDEREGLDPLENLGRAIGSYRRSLELHPEQIAAWNNLGQVYLKRAGFELNRGVDSGESLDLATEAFEEALAIDPDQMVLHYNRARSFVALADRRTLAGDDPSPMLEQAVESYRKAIEINPESAHVAQFRNGLGIASYALAVQLRRSGQDASARLEQAEREFAAAMQANPRLVFPPANIALVEFLRAVAARERGGDPAPSAERAIAAADRAIEVNSEYMPAHDAKIYALILLLEARSERGEGFDEVARRGRAAASAALELQPESVSTLGVAVELELELARAAERAGRTSKRERENARAFSARADAVAPGSSTAVRAASRVVLEDIRTGRGDGDVAEKVIGRLTTLIEGSVGEWEARALRGALRLELAIAPAGARKTSAALDAAREDLGSALAADARLVPEFEPLLERARSIGP